MTIYQQLLLQNTGAGLHIYMQVMVIQKDSTCTVEQVQQSISLGLIPRIPSSAPWGPGLRGSDSTLRRSTPSVAAFLHWQGEIVVSLQLAPTNRDPSFLSWNRQCWRRAPRLHSSGDALGGSASSCATFLYWSSMPLHASVRAAAKVDPDK